MTDLNSSTPPVTDVPAPTPVPPSTPQPVPLAELYPACFDWKKPKPLKVGIHKDLLATDLAQAGIKIADLKRALARYCSLPRYRKTLRAGIVRVDLQGQPAGLVTEEEAVRAKAELAAWKAKKEGKPVPPLPLLPGQSPAFVSHLPPHDTPLPKEHLVPGRLELTVKFSELPKPLQVQGGMKIGVQTGEGVVTTILSTKVWRKLEQAAKDYPSWVAALSGALDRVADGEIVLKQPALQVFEKKAKPEVKAPEAKAPEEPTSPAPPASSVLPKLSLKGRTPPNASE